MADSLELSDYQRRVLAVPEAFDLFLGGGRGGAKSFTLAMLALRHAEEHRERWGMRRATGVADDACFAHHGHGTGSIADEFRAYDVDFRPARKADRRTGWERMRRLFEAAGKPDVPGLYVARPCAYFWETVPYLARDPRRVDDVDSRGPDHAANAARYAVLADRSPSLGERKLEGLY